MQRSIIDSTTKAWVNVVELDDDSTWQPKAGFELIDATGNTGSIWNGTSFDHLVPTDLRLARLRIERNTKLTESDWTQCTDSQLSDEDKASWATYRQELRDLTANSPDPSNPTWPDAPE